MGRITALTAQRGRRDRLNVFLDGEFAFGIGQEEAVRAGLRNGLELTPADVERLRERDEAAGYFNDALRFLSFRPRSLSEIERYLHGRGADEVKVTEALERLKRTGLVDDEAFARYWVENRDAFSPRGSRALQAELRAKGVGREHIAEALAEAEDEVSEDERAYQAALKRARSLSRADEESFRRRLYGFLQRRGFDYETTRKTTDRLWQEGTEGIE